MAKKAAPKKRAKKKVAKTRKAAPIKMLPAARKQTAKRAFDKKTDSAYDPKWVPPVYDDDLLLGAHVSIAGGTHHAPFRAPANGPSQIEGGRSHRIPRNRPVLERAHLVFQVIDNAGQPIGHRCGSHLKSILQIALPVLSAGRELAHDRHQFRLHCADLLAQERV